MKVLTAIFTLITTAAAVVVPSKATFAAFYAARIVGGGYANTANELIDGTACRPVTVIYARGSGKSGNIGRAGDVGPVFLNELSLILGAENVAAQGVTCDCSVWGFIGGGDERGIAKMAELVALANTQCPETKIVMAGYSQGGQLLHKSADKLVSNEAATKQVAAVLIFGDADNGDTTGNVPENKVKIICHDWDFICQVRNGWFPSLWHIDYALDAKTGAEWVASMLW